MSVLCIQYNMRLIYTSNGKQKGGFMTDLRRESVNTGSDMLVMQEIRHALAQLFEIRKTTVIDLKSIPMTPDEEATLEATLGEENAMVKVTAKGTSRLIETDIAAVWLLTHYNINNEVLGKFIEVTYEPSLLIQSKDEVGVV
jgi:hydrogenase-1 operon protein HyaF